jgi:RNA polymerase sigma factor (sigma-70 family)
MAAGPLSTVLHHLRGMLRVPPAEPGDGRLLERFAQDRDEEAFAELVRRHGPMVLGVCRRVLRHEQDAEDAFQATFLVLARKAGSLDRRGSVAAWLYTVAYHLALRARTAAARRRFHERQAAAMNPTEVPADAGSDLRPVLDEELQRLPERYRAPLVLCYLQGKTNAEAARELGWPGGSMARRLGRGLELLRSRLARRGITLAGGGIGVALAEDANAAIPGALLRTTVGAAVAFAAGASGSASPVAAELARGMLRTTAATRVGSILAVLAGLAALASAGALAVRSPAPPPEHAAAAPMPAASVRTDRYGDPLPPGAVARLGTVRWRSIGLSYFLEFSPDDRVLASVCWDRVILWDAATGRQLRRMSLPVSPANGRAFTPDGKTLLVLDGSGTITFWDVATGKRVRTLALPRDKAGERYAYGMRLSPDGSLLAVQDSTGKPLLLDAVSGRLVHALGSAGAGFDTVAFAPDGKTIATSAYTEKGFQIKLWDVATGKLVRDIGGPKKPPIYDLTFSPDGKTLACSNGAQVSLMDVATDKEISRFDAPERSAWSLHFTSDYDDTTAPHQVRVWDAATGTELGHFEGRATDVSALAFSPDGRRLVSGLRDGSVLVWDLTTLPRPPALDLPPGGLPALWTDLAGSDAGRANRAAWTLAVHPDAAIPFLKEHVPPAAAVDERQVRRWIADLDSDRFETRATAAKELEAAGAQAAPALRAALAGKPSPEVRKQAEALLGGLRLVRLPELLRRLRAIQVLERIGSSEARAVLDRLAHGAVAARETRDAAAALHRLAGRLGGSYK